MLSVVVVFISFVVLTYLGFTAPWSPAHGRLERHAGAGENDLLGRHGLAGERTSLTPLQLQGAVVLQNKDCRNCHALDGKGGHRGPDLNGVATRLTHDQLVRQVIQGGGNMPAYGKQLKPAEVTALVDFLSTLKPRGQQPAREPG